MSIYVELFPTRLGSYSIWMSITKQNKAKWLINKILFLTVLEAERLGLDCLLHGHFLARALFWQFRLPACRCILNES